ALLHLEVPVTEIQRQTEALRDEIFTPFFHGGYKTFAQLRDGEQQLKLKWIVVGEGSLLSGMTVEDITTHDTTVVGILRHGQLRAEPQPDLRLLPGDMVVLLASHDAYETL